MGRNSLYACLVKFGGHNLNGFTPNSTGQIRLVGQIQPGINYWSNWVEIHSFGGHNLKGFTPNLTGQIWGKSIEIDAGRFGCKSIEIDYIAC